MGARAVGGGVGLGVGAVALVLAARLLRAGGVGVGGLFVLGGVGFGFALPVFGRVLVRGLVGRVAGGVGLVGLGVAFFALVLAAAARVRRVGRVLADGVEQGLELAVVRRERERVLGHDFRLRVLRVDKELGGAVVALGHALRARGRRCEEE